MNYWDSVPEAQREGFAPACKGSTYVIDNAGNQQVSDKWECRFGGGETLDLDGDGIPDAMGKGEINVDGICFALIGLYNPTLLVTDMTMRGQLDSRFHSGKAFDPYLQKYLCRQEFQNTFGQLFIQSIGKCLDYEFMPEHFVKEG